MPAQSLPGDRRVDVVDVAEASRFEVRMGGETVGFADYLRTDALVVHPHTVIDPAYNGRGLGSALARAVLEDARERGLPVPATCPFIAAWRARHPECQALAHQNRSRVTD